MTLLAVTAVGDDRAGIVAALTAALSGRGGNVEDASMTLLRGHFAMTLLVSGAGTADGVEVLLAPVAERLGVILHVREVSTEVPSAGAGSPYVVTVHGADRPGIVAGVTAVLAGHAANITDLTTRLVGDLYVLTCEVDVPGGTDVDRLGADLVDVATELGVEAGLRPADADVL